MVGLQYSGKNRVRPGGPNVPLTPPDMRTVKHISGDSNCLFRSFACIITGSEDQHMAVRTVILEHIMINIAHFIIFLAIPLFKSIQVNVERDCIKSRRDKIGITRHLCPFFAASSTFDIIPTTIGTSKHHK